MKHIPLILGLTLFLLSYTSCDRLGKEEKCERDYSFSIPVTLSPALDTFHIGDTIHISMEFPTEMEDKNTEEFFDMSDFPFNTQLSIAKLDTNPAFCGNILMEYIEQEGTLNFLLLSVGCLVVKAGFKKKDQDFIFSCNIVLTTEGLYALGSNSVFLDKYTLPIKETCKTTSIKINYSLTPIGGDSNFDLLKYAKDPQKQILTKEFFDSGGAFVFFVIK